MVYNKGVLITAVLEGELLVPVAMVMVLWYNGKIEIAVIHYLFFILIGNFDAAGIGAIRRKER